MSGSGLTQLDLFSPRAATSPAEAPHGLLSERSQADSRGHTCRSMNAAICVIMHPSGRTGYQSGTADACLMTGHRGQRTGAGR